MTPELRSLIEASVVNGQVDANARKIILAKASQQGINEDECNIFIASVIRAQEGQQKAIKAEVNYKAYSLIAVALIEYSYAISIGDISNAGPYIGFAVLTGSIFLLWGLHLLGQSVFKFLRRIGWIIILYYLSAFLLALPMLAISVIPFSVAILNKLSAAFTYLSLILSFLSLILWLTAIVMFRVKVFGMGIVSKYPNAFVGAKN